MNKTTIVTTPVTGISGVVLSIGQPVGALMAIGLGIASFLNTSLEKGIGPQLAIGLIVAGFAVFHVTVSNIAG